VIPTFEPEGGPLLVLLRGGADAGLLSAFGSLLALSWLAPPLLPLLGASAPGTLRVLRRVAGVSILSAIVLAACWLLGESKDMAGTVSAAPAVLQETLFGQLIAARVAMLVVAGLLLAVRRHWPATLLAALATALQAGHDHAWAMAGGISLLLVSNVVHVLAAGAWLGGLLPLLVLVAYGPPEAAARASRRFSILGTACVILIAATALFQASTMAGSWSGLVGTAYGWVLAAKLALLLGLVAIAVRNRFQLTPALGRSSATTASLVRSIGIETACVLLIILAAALLTSLQPGMDMAQRPSHHSDIVFVQNRNGACPTPRCSALI
jgi:putative copper resistance protein D